MIGTKHIESKKLFLVVTTWIAFAVSSFAQTEGDWSKHGYKSYGEKDYYGSSYYFNLAIEQDSNNIDLWWYYAESNRLANEYKTAESGYKSLIDKDIDIKYPQGMFFLADMLKRQEKYDEARVYFKFYRDIETDKTNLLYKRAKEEILACTLAESWKKMTPIFEVEHPQFDLNSFDAEFSPVIVNDTFVFFSALRYDAKESKELNTFDEVYRSMIYQASFTDSAWEISPFDSIINDSLTDNANPALSPDSSQIYFTRCDDEGCAIWVSNWDEDHWENAAKLGPNINLEGYSSTHPYIATAANGKTYLFFASNRARTRGKMDIWSVEIKDNGFKFGRPKNAGRNVNTKDDEITPFYNSKTSELYFSSLYHKGFGGFDVFHSKGQPGKFAKPRNAGMPINSPVNDMYYNYSNAYNVGAFVSNRSDGYALKGSTCCNDIYFFGDIDTNEVDTPTIDVPVEEDLVIRLKAVQFLPLALYFDNDQPNPRTKQITTNKTYQETFDTYLQRKSKFAIEAPNPAKIDSFFVQNVEVGFTKLQMLSDSLIKYLDMGYKLQLGIKGFTSPLGNTEYNDNLAMRRISSIENYLYECKSGALQPAIDSGLLKFRQIPFGEFFSLGKVNDDYNSQKQSVYSASASEARKVEIIWVEQTLPGDSNAIAIFEKTTHNFNTLPNDKIVSNTFKFTNTGESPLTITRVTGDCDCVTVKYPTQEILPGESGEIVVSFNTSGRKGLQFHGVVVQTNAKTSEKKLFIRGVMEVVLSPEQ